MGRNLNKVFYKDYFNSIDFSYALNDSTPKDSDKLAIGTVNNLLLSSRLPRENKLADFYRSISEERFTLKVCYPGLVTGIGLVHDSKKLEGALNLGMHFDYTYGIPVIYGSSVKGVLRAYFKEFYKGNKKEEMLKDIFDGIKKGAPKPMNERDVFFDAVLISGCKNRNGVILDTDSITSHREGPLKEPNPVSFLKVAAGSTFEFFFKLEDSDVGGEILSKRDKLDLFKEILLTVGAGAKTNVGYGQFEL